MNNSVAIVIPAFNESKVLAKVLSQLKNVMNKSNLQVELIVVDDSSTDNTAKIAELAKATVIKHILNTGSGGATATGLSYAEQQGYNYAATIDADGQHDASDLVRGINFAIESKTDLLIGSRLINSDGMSRVKILGNKGLTFITRILFGVGVTDSQSGMRVFSRKSLEQLKWKTSGYEFCSEMLWRAKQLGLKIDEFPIKAIYTEYSKSKGQNNWNAFNIIKSLLKRRIVEVFGE